MSPMAYVQNIQLFLPFKYNNHNTNYALNQLLEEINTLSAMIFSMVTSDFSTK